MEKRRRLPLAERRAVYDKMVGGVHTVVSS